MEGAYPARAGSCTNGRLGTKTRLHVTCGLAACRNLLHNTKRWQWVCATGGPMILGWLLLDSRVVDVPRSSHLIVVTLSSSKPFFVNGLKKAVPFAGDVGAEFTFRTLFSGAMRVFEACPARTRSLAREHHARACRAVASCRQHGRTPGGCLGRLRASAAGGPRAPPAMASGPRCGPSASVSPGPVAACAGPHRLVLDGRERCRRWPGQAGPRGRAVGRWTGGGARAWVPACAPPLPRTLGRPQQGRRRRGLRGPPPATAAPWSPRARAGGAPPAAPAAAPALPPAPRRRSARALAAIGA